ncbi:MAG: TVP38/TMEM64 family protein [Deltaproteobacteria bacterium]|jgi:uncharacterized membrane protein YdjX (TVP38/TMEM64 family)|nr:TVP38/TMEM64 family protein [Deltaproteobacteria bacterium]MBT6435257.1 TVP38/TMEM64 family protein [Deltaproteobacteria bacterium]
MNRGPLFQLVPFLIVFVTVAFITTQLGIDAQTIEVWLDGKGIWGPLMFIAVFAVLQALFVSAHIFIMAANAVWLPAEAIFYSWLGAMGSGLISFVFARFVARQWVQQRLPEKIKEYDHKLEDSGFLTVLILRTFLFTSPPLQLGLGVSRVKFWPFLAGTALGNIPPILLSTFAASSILAWFQS